MKCLNLPAAPKVKRLSRRIVKSVELKGKLDANVIYSMLTGRNFDTLEQVAPQQDQCVERGILLMRGVRVWAKRSGIGRSRWG